MKVLIDLDDKSLEGDLYLSVFSGGDIMEVLRNRNCISDEPIVGWMVVDHPTGDFVKFARTEELAEGVRPYSRYYPLFAGTPKRPKG